MPLLLLLLFGLALITAAAMVTFITRLVRINRFSRKLFPTHNLSGDVFPSSLSYLRRPSCWLTIKSTSLTAVQSALGLHNPKPCSWSEGLAGEKKLFIAPPVKGWILVVGAGLPDPSEDVDACFRFILDASRRLGQVQFFSASPIVHHH